MELNNFFNLTDVELDLRRDVILDKTNSVLHVPITSNQITESAKLKWPKIKIKIKLAKKYVKPGSGCSSCVNCIGFRCKITAHVVPKVATIEEDAESDDDIAAKPNKPLTRIREQMFWVKINKTNMTIDYYPIENIEWDAL